MFLNYWRNIYWTFKIHSLKNLGDRFCWILKFPGTSTIEKVTSIHLHRIYFYKINYISKFIQIFIFSKKQDSSYIRYMGSKSFFWKIKKIYLQLYCMNYKFLFTEYENFIKFWVIVDFIKVSCTTLWTAKFRVSTSL